MIGHCLIAGSATRAQVKHLWLHAMGSSAFCNLEDDLLDAAHGVGVIGFEKMQDLDHRAPTDL